MASLRQVLIIPGRRATPPNRNLDEHPDLRGQNTATEFMARNGFDAAAARIAVGGLDESALIEPTWPPRRP